MGDNIVINAGIINDGVVQKGNTAAEAGASAANSDKLSDVRTNEIVLNADTVENSGVLQAFPSRGIKKKFDFDIAIYYSSEETRYVSRVVQILKAEGLRVFFAPDCEEEYTAKDMIAEFYTIYRYRSMFVAAFVSKSYIAGDITMHEASTALLRTEDEKRNCLIPVYMDDSRLEKLNPDINYIEVNRKGCMLREVETADKIVRIVKRYIGKGK